MRTNYIICLICNIFLILSLYYIKNSPVAGYELSIYTGTPVLVWILLLGAMIGGMFIIIRQSFSQYKSEWLAGFLILILINFIILSLAGLRGYYQYGTADHLIHLQIMNDLMNTGSTVKWENFYPIIHILAVQIADIAGLVPENIVNFLPAYLSVLFLILFNYLLAKSSLCENGSILLASIAGFIPFFHSLHVQIYPHTFSVLLFTMIFYLYFQMSKRWEFKILFILSMIILPFTHPSGSLVIIIILILMELSRIYHEKILYKSRLIIRKISLYPIYVSFIVFFTWLSSFYIFGTKILSLYSSIVEPLQNEHVVTVIKTAQRLDRTELLTYFLKMYAGTLIIIIISLIAGIIIIKNIKEKETRYLFLLLIFFLVTIPIGYFIFVGIGSETAGRFLNLPYIMIVTPTLVGFALYELFKKRKFAVMFTMIILVSVSIISFLTVYHSPWIMTAGLDVTNMDLKGSIWFQEYRNPSLEFEPLGTDIFQIPSKEIIPEDFNYTVNRTLGEAIQLNSYVTTNRHWEVSNTIDILSKSQLSMRNGWGFSQKDIDDIEEDKTVSQIYSNGEFKIFRINP